MWWFLHSESITCLEIHDLLLITIGMLDEIAELVRFINGSLSKFLAILIEVGVGVAIEFILELGGAKAHDLVVHLNIF